MSLFNQWVCLAGAAILCASTVAVAEDQAIEVREPVEFERTPAILSCDATAGQVTADELAVFDVSFSRNGKSMATGNSQGHVIIWRTKGDGKKEEHQALHRIVDRHKTPIRHVRYINNDQWLASLDLDGRVMVWSVSDGKQIKELDTPNAVLALAVGKDTRRLFGLTDKPTIRTWTIDDQQQIVAGKEIDLDDEFRLLSASEQSNDLLLASSVAWEVRRSPDLNSVVGKSIEPAIITAIRMSPAGKKFALGMRDGSIRVYQSDTGQESYQWKKHPNAVTCLVFSASGNTLLSGCLRDRIRVWDLQKGQHINDRDVGLKLVTSLELSPDGKHLSAAGMGSDLAYFGVQQAAKKFIPATSRPKGWNRKAMFGVRFVPGTQEIAVVVPMRSVFRPIRSDW